MFCRFYIVFLFCFAIEGYSKEIPEELLEDIYTQAAENSEAESVDLTQVYEDLQFYAQNPINLNQTSKEELERLHFLSAAQIENLLYYIYMHFPLENSYELQLVPGFYKQDIRNLLPFIKVEKVEKHPPKLSLKKIGTYGKHQLISRTDAVLEKKKGYASATENNYLGSPLYASLKYRFSYSKRLLAGFTAEKDAGEPFDWKYNKGFDFYGAYLQLNDIKKLKTVVIGDYVAAYGQGLVVGSGYGFGKSGMVLQVESQKAGLRKYSSTNEYAFFRGIGTSWKFGKLDCSAFYSFRTIDGDTVNGAFASIKKDGLHRTSTDFTKKHSVNQQLLGAHIGLSYTYARFGFTLSHVQLDKPLLLKPYPYNSLYFRGKEQTAAGVHYAFRWQQLRFFGETAMANNNGFATLSGLSFSPVSSVGIVCLHRYYSTSYDVLFSQSFSENSKANNEEGFYLGVEVHPFQYWKFSAYADAFRFPWLKYGVDKPSAGYDLFFQANYNPVDALSMYFRFRTKQKEKNSPLDNPTTHFQQTQRSSFRYVLQYALDDNINLQNTIESSYYTESATPSSWGWVLGQDLNYFMLKPALSFDLRYEIFDAQNYANRIYFYEKDVLYAFSIPALYGKGSRAYLLVKYALSAKVSVQFKLAQTVYAEQKSIGTGREEIEGNTKTDVKLLLRWKL